MKHHYRVVLRDGTVHWASEVDHLPGFVKIKSWDGEMRLPAGDVTEVYSSKLERFSWAALSGSIVFLLFVLVIFIVSGS